MHFQLLNKIIEKEIKDVETLAKKVRVFNLSPHELARWAVLKWVQRTMNMKDEDYVDNDHSLANENPKLSERKFRDAVQHDDS